MSLVSGKITDRTHRFKIFSTNGMRSITNKHNVKTNPYAAIGAVPCPIIPLSYSEIIL